MKKLDASHGEKVQTDDYGVIVDKYSHDTGEIRSLVNLHIPTVPDREFVSPSVVA